MGLPVLRLADIPNEGLTLSYDLRAEELMLTPDEARLPNGLSLSLEIFRIGTSVHVTGLLAGTFLRECVRCLKEYEDSTRLPVSVEYRPVERPKIRQAKSIPAEPENLLGPEQDLGADVYSFLGDRLDLTGMVREQVIMATPMQPLCSEECRGLCPVCKQDRNQVQCGCIEMNRPNPFSVLRRLSRPRETSPPTNPFENPLQN